MSAQGQTQQVAQEQAQQVEEWLSDQQHQVVQELWLELDCLLVQQPVRPRAQDLADQARCLLLACLAAVDVCQPEACPQQMLLGPACITQAWLGTGHCAIHIGLTECPSLDLHQ